MLFEPITQTHTMTLSSTPKPVKPKKHHDADDVDGDMVIVALGFIVCIICVYAIAQVFFKK